MPFDSMSSLGDIFANGLAQLCHACGTAVPSCWHSCAKALAQVFRRDVTDDAPVCPVS